jgi:UDP-glucose 4-epimerase
MYTSIDFTIFRLFTCYGPLQSLTDPKKGIVAIFMNQFINNDNIIVKGSLERYRDFIYIDDVVEIIKESLYNKAFYNKILNLGTGIKTTIKELLCNINTIGNFNKEIIVNNPVKGDMFGCVANNQKLLEILPNYKFKTVSEGIINTFKFYRNI